MRYTEKKGKIFLSHLFLWDIYYNNFIDIFGSKKGLPWSIKICNGYVSFAAVPFQSLEDGLDFKDQILRKELMFEKCNPISHAVITLQ